MVLKRSGIGFGLALVMLVLAGCASAMISLNVERTPTINTTGIRRIAIMPFQASGSSSHADLQRETAQNITSTATTRIQATRHFELVDPAEIQRLQSLGESIENHVDALFSGNIVNLDVKEGTRVVTRYNVVSRRNEDVTLYFREIELAFNFYFSRARDGSIVGTATTDVNRVASSSAI